MEFRQLRMFLTVARLRSFTQAAEQLHIAQPAISIAIRKLEQELELTLLNRRDKQVSLTPEGAALLRHAERLLAGLDEARLEMRELRGLKKGEVRIGIPSMLGSYYFPRLLMAFKHRHPDLRLSVQEEGTRRIQQLIERGELDLGVIVRDEIPATLEAEVFLREEMVACLPRSHPLASAATISYEAFFAEQLVVFKEGYFHREFINNVSQRLGLEPQIAFETNLIPLMKSLVRQEFAISTFLRMVLADEPDLVAVPFTEPVFLDLSIAWKKGGYLAHADRAFLDFVLQQRPAALETRS